MEPIQECLDVRGFYLHSLTLRQVFIDQVERGQPVSVWRFHDSHMLPMGAEVVLAPHDSELWVYVPGSRPFVVDAAWKLDNSGRAVYRPWFSGDPAALASIIEAQDLLDWECDSESRPRPPVRYEMWEARQINDARRIRGAR